MWSGVPKPKRLFLNLLPAKVDLYQPGIRNPRSAIEEQIITNHAPHRLHRLVPGIMRWVAAQVPEVGILGGCEEGKDLLGEPRMGV